MAASRAILQRPVRFKLAGVETDRVYWLFDEGENVVRGGVEIQHSFRFNKKAPEGIESFRRVDAFYKKSDTYRHVMAQVRVSNLKVASTVSLDTEGLRIATLSDFKGLRLSKITLTKYEDGIFKVPVGRPTGLATSGNEAFGVWNYLYVASVFGYSSAEEAKIKLGHDASAWALFEYKSPKGAELTMARPLQQR